MSFKAWAACRHTHAAITAALELRAAGALQRPITVRTCRAVLIFCDRSEPRTQVRRYVRVEERADLTETYPHNFSAEVETPFANVTYRDSLRDPERPLSNENLIAKARALLQWGGIAPGEAGDTIRAMLDAAELQKITTTLGPLV